ncbi:ABC-2 type transport system permease protein [Isoptericola sp. CG 20/1183]|uniref:ABC-2 type transport system permease protein n=1 Tax=Isoptericola halotolerans TaxID=300560 RepID=A0ABX5EIY3_9MICO|nr:MULTISPECIES: ABC transporter permease [Isoptericola]PRZ08506.1 ABC-2 type transport system permease protein [Isoptericola halotolerans]PRZ11047.1 ABC-2 type transport system permease protein [Isoptericola sp. CG 20/1183]
MTTANPASATPRVVSPLRLAWLHLKFQFLETVRIPMAVIGNAVFPALAMVFFVVPQDSVAGNPQFATMAVAGLAMFAVCSASLFTYGLGVAEDRALPFDPFVRSLPAGPGPRMVARVGNGAIFTLVGLLPLIAVAWLFTSAAVTATQLAAGVGMILLASVPFVLLGMAVGYSLTAKAALPVVQVVLFPLAFAGGLFLPPMMFPAWLDTLSQLTPTRAARDLLVQALTGAPANPWAWPVLVGWTAVFAALAAWAYRRDEGRRFR